MGIEWAPGLRPRWVREKRLAVSPMPRIGEEEKIVKMFNTVISLSPPSEHVLSGGYNPRALQSLKPGIRVIWRPVGEYNAPTLVDVVRILRGAKAEPILVHCFRGCGRSSVLAAAWLMVEENISLPEALAEVASRTSCGPETAPQLGVLEAFDVARRAGLLDKLYADYDIDDPVPEYVMLLSRSLSSFTGHDPVELASKALTSDGVLFAAKILANRFDYRVARIYAENRRITVLVWIPRRAHPSNVRGVSGDSAEVSEEIASILRKRLGVNVDAAIVVRRPGDVPWL